MTPSANGTITAFFAIFNNTQDADREDESPTLLAYTAEEKSRREQLTVQLAELERALQEMESTTPSPGPASSGPLQTRFVRIQLTAEETFFWHSRKFRYGSAKKTLVGMGLQGK